MYKPIGLEFSHFQVISLKKTEILSPWVAYYLHCKVCPNCGLIYKYLRDVLKSVEGLTKPFWVRYELTKRSKSSSRFLMPQKPGAYETSTLTGETFSGCGVVSLHPVQLISYSISETKSTVTIGFRSTAQVREMFGALGDPDPCVLSGRKVITIPVPAESQTTSEAWVSSTGGMIQS